MVDETDDHMSMRASTAGAGEPPQPRKAFREKAVVLAFAMLCIIATMMWWSALAYALWRLIMP